MMKRKQVVLVSMIMLCLAFPAHAELPNFSTLPALNHYKVDKGGQDADILQGLAFHPFWAPRVNLTDNREIVFRWTFYMNSELSDKDFVGPNYLKIHLFKPRNPEQIPPMPPVSEDPSGFIVKGENKQLEDSELWKNYINPYFVHVDGVDVIANTRDDLNSDRDNIVWPGKRRSHMTRYVAQYGNLIAQEEIPLRVSAVVDESINRFLIVTEIDRTLRLGVRAYRIDVQYMDSVTRRSVLDKILSVKLNLGEAKKIYDLRFESVK